MQPLMPPRQKELFEAIMQSPANIDATLAMYLSSIITPKTISWETEAFNQGFLQMDPESCTIALQEYLTQKYSEKAYKELNKSVHVEFPDDKSLFDQATEYSISTYGYSKPKITEAFLQAAIFMRNKYKKHFIQLEDAIVGLEYMTVVSKKRFKKESISGILYKMKELIDAKFPDTHMISHVTKLKQEIKEFEQALHDGNGAGNELVDVFLCFLACWITTGWGGNALTKQSIEKIEQNMQREWIRQADGTYQHVDK